MFIVGDEFIYDEIPEEMSEILDRLPSSTRDRAEKLAKTLSVNDNFTAYIIPRVGFILFSGDVNNDKKVCRVLLHANGELKIDNKKKMGEMFCPLFDALEDAYANRFGRHAELDSEDTSYKCFDRFIPGVLEVLNDTMVNKPEILQ